MEKIDTRFVVGGVYSRELSANTKISGVLLGSSLHGSGRRVGAIYTEGHAAVSVVEGTDSLNEWKLEMEPISSDLLREIEANHVQRLERLEQKVAAMAAPPASLPEADPMKDLVVLDGRKAKQSANARS